MPGSAPAAQLVPVMFWGAEKPNQGINSAGHFDREGSKQINSAGHLDKGNSAGHLDREGSNRESRTNNNR